MVLNAFTHNTLYIKNDRKEVIPIANLNSLLVNGVSRFLNPINGNITGTASNVTGTVAIANGGTGATTRLGAAQALTNEAVATPGYVVGLTSNWAKFGYTSIDQLKTTIGSASAASGGTAITMVTTGEKYIWNSYGSGSARDDTKLPLSGGTMTGTIITPADNSKGIRPATNNYGEIGDSSYWYNRTYCKDIYNTRTIVCADQSAISTGRKLVIESDDIYFADGDTRDTWDGTNSYLKTAISSLANRKYIYGSWREPSNKTGTGSSHPTIQSFSFTTTGRPLVIILSAPISVSRYTGSIRLIMDNSGILEASTNSQTMFRATNMIIKTDVTAGTHNFVIDLSAQDAGTTTTLYSYNPYSVMMFEL